MSRIGKMPIDIPSNVTVAISGDNIVTVSGPLGTLSQAVDKKITVKQEGTQVLVSRSSDENMDRALHGLYRALIHNMIEGVTKGFSKTLVIAGVGYKAVKQGNKLVLSLGYSHPIEYVEPEGIKFETKDANTIVVCEVAAKIRGFRPVEPYHLYGIHYDYEHLTKKEGKKAAATKK